MTRKILAFIITIIFLGLAVWWINANPDKLPQLGMDTKSRIVKNLSWETEPELLININKKYIAEMETTAGVMKFELFTDETPKTVNNFVFLAREGFYENTFFHRIINGFMIQGGDPRGDGTGGPGYSFPNEPVTRDYERGILAMANAGPDTNGSQFFIMHARQELPKDYTIFGQLIYGEETLDKIATGQVRDNGHGEPSFPVKKTYIDSVKIIES